MFATLLGALPHPAANGDADELIRTAVRAQEEAGLEPITDGRLGGEIRDWVAPDGAIDVEAAVAAWRFAAGATDRAVKQALPGPYSIGSSAGESPRERAKATEAGVESLRTTIERLAAAGCPLIEIEETEAHLIGADTTERERFRSAHRALTDGIAGVHLSLSIVGGSAWEAGLETILDAPYSSLAVDLIEGPDNWNLVTRLPRERGVIVGALPAKASPADSKEMLLWAARYAAGSKGRGLDRVGLGSAGSFANLTWEAAVEKLHRLGEAARLASMQGGANLARELDPRAVNARTAAMGHDTIRNPRPRNPRPRNPEPSEPPRDA